MALISTNAQSYIPDPGCLLDLFTLDSRYISVNGNQYFWHPGVNGLYQPLIFNGVTYTAFPIELTDWGTDGKGNPVRPKLRASNINGYVSQFLLTQGDLVGAKLTRTRVFARFIDAANFTNNVNPYGTPDPSAAYEPDIFFVNRKVVETPEVVEMELTSPWEIDNVQLPRRPALATVCSAVYRDGETCGYVGVPVSDRFGKLFAAAAPAGYGYTLNARGTWAAGNTYAVGDWVTIVSASDFTFGELLVYVCGQAGTTGAINNPQFNETNWVADACPHNLLGCTAHFPLPAQLPLLAYPGLSRASYV
jgi:lambda family phage minor tail protein L